jgi:hypothetical protein
LKNPHHLVDEDFFVLQLFLETKSKEITCDNTCVTGVEIAVSTFRTLNLQIRKEYVLIYLGMKVIFVSLK